MPSRDAFGYEYLLTIGRSEKLIRASVPTTQAFKSWEPFVVATADNPTTPETIRTGASGVLMNSYGIGYGVLTDPINYPGSEDFRTVTTTSFEVFDKQLQAEINNSKESDNFSTITIYNLTKEQLDLIKENSNVILRGGYRTELNKVNPDRKDLPILYVGEVISATTVNDGEDKITDILLNDGRTPMRNIKVSKSWPPGTRYLDMLFDMIDLAGEAGIPLGRLEGDTRARNLEEAESSSGIFTEGVSSGSIRKSFNIPTRVIDETLINYTADDGYQVVGILGEEIARLANMIGYRAYLSLGQLYLEPFYVEPLVEVVNLTSENIKGNIDLEEDGSIGLSGDGLEKSGIKLKTFLNGRITTSKYLRLSNLLNSEFEGDYRINSVTHSLDYEGDTWDTEISATRLK